MAKPTKKVSYENILVGSNVEFIFRDHDSYKVYLTSTSFDDEPLDWNDVEVLIEWLQKIQPKMKKKFIIGDNRYSEEEARELFNKLKDYLMVE